MTRSKTVWKKVVACTCFAALLACAALFASGCSSTGSSSGTRSFTDDLGRTVELPAKVEKIVPSGHTSNQVLLTIAPDKMVGISQSMDDAQTKIFGEKYAQLPVLGAIFGAKGDLNKEAVVNTGAQLLIDVGEEKSGMADDLNKLQEQLGIPCVHISATIDTWDKAYTRLGELLNVKDRAKTISDYCAKTYKTVSDVMAKISESERVTFANLCGEDGLHAIAKGAGGQSQVIDMITNNVVVVENVSSKGTGNEINLEQLSVWDPEVIVFGPQSMYDNVQSDPVWLNLTAIKTGEVYEVPAQPYNWLNNPPTVNQLMGMQWLARLLYPDMFSDSIEDVTKSYYKTFYNYNLTNAELEELLAKAQ